MLKNSKVTDINNTPDTDNDIIDIDLKELRKKRFRLDRDNDRVIELNTSDISVIKRLEEIYPKMLKLVDEVNTKQTDDDTESPDIIDRIQAIDQEMRKLLNYGFDSDVADKACPQGTLYDPINGKFRFEYIFERLIGLYDDNFKREFDLMRKRVDKHTSKYTKKRK